MTDLRRTIRINESVIVTKLFIIFGVTFRGTIDSGTIACQVYSLNRKIIYAAWARNFSALKPFFDV